MQFRGVAAICLATLATITSACVPGYIKPKDLKAKGWGPDSCIKSCQELGRRMTALVLVSQVPACVCQPLVTAAPPAAVAAPPPAAAPPVAPPPPGAAPPAAAPPVSAPPASRGTPHAESDDPVLGAAASAAGMLVIEAEEESRYQQQSYQPPSHSYTHP
jgi:hypothetical protein